jgi:hypothetical protein
MLATRLTSSAVPGSRLGSVAVPNRFAIPPLPTVDQLVASTDDCVGTEGMHSGGRQDVFTSEPAVPHDEANDFHAGLIQQEVADGSEFPAGVR